jgi:NAD(P)-dependent dehydrogenase (short-subunit alcohol dehydrogenase family)
MHGKTVLVTGATQGIGKATAAALAARGARVVLLARREDRGRAAQAEIEAASRGRGRVELLVADLSSLAEVRRAAAEFKAKYDRLDVLINNAGVLVPRRRVTVDGIEETFAVNHVAPFLLTRELLDVLRASAPARIVNVSSEAHRHAKMYWEDLQFLRRPYRAWCAYRQSKLANLLFTYELAHRLDHSGITANALHPGVVATGFGQTYGGLTGVLIKLAHPFMASPEQGARTSVVLACAPHLAGVTGAYSVDGKRVPSNAVSYCRASQRKLWALSDELARAGGRQYPDATGSGARLPAAPSEGGAYGHGGAAYGGAFSRLS